MSKRLIAVLVILSVAAAGAFAQIGLGVNAAIYSDTSMSADDFTNQLRNGEGVFYGPFIEIAFRKTALGLSGNFSFYQEDWSFDQDGSYMLQMMDYDVTLYLQGHLIKYKSVVDPFLEVGIGIMAKDFANSEDDPDPDNPLQGTKYWQAGGGLGINIGALGIFIKGLYLFPFGTVEGTYTLYNPDGTVYSTDNTYDISSYPLQNLKLIVGAKIIL